jgi:hypothetical protein
MSLDLAGYRTEHHKPNFAVIGAGRENERWPSSSLFMAGPRVPVDPDRLTALWYPVSYHDSLPRLGPFAISGCRFFFVTPARRRKLFTALADLVRCLFSPMAKLTKHQVRAKRPRAEIALQAIEGASGAKALAHINQIAMEQAKPRSPQN